jgi:hypothetical protein
MWICHAALERAGEDEDVVLSKLGQQEILQLLVMTGIASSVRFSMYVLMSSVVPMRAPPATNPL